MAKRPATDSVQTEKAPTIETAEETAERLGKGRATPTRKEREAANRRPLVPEDRKEASRQARASQATAREKARVGMAAGDDRYLTARDKGPQRRYVRDYVDARFSAGEILIPVMVVVLAISFIPATQTYALIILWVFFLIAVIDAIVLGQMVLNRMKKKFGADKIERGVRWYAAMRAMQLRMIRLPKPQVKRGQYPS
jgi:hypothetical protein